MPADDDRPKHLPDSPKHLPTNTARNICRGDRPKNA